MTPYKRHVKVFDRMWNACWMDFEQAIGLRLPETIRRALFFPR